MKNHVPVCPKAFTAQNLLKKCKHIWTNLHFSFILVTIFNEFGKIVTLSFKDSLHFS